MRVNDPHWLHIANLAKVRTPHCWQLFCYMKALKGKFSIGGYAAFSGLEVRHVERMLAVFEAEGLGNPMAPQPLAPKGARLAADFIMPAEWINWAMVQRLWTEDVAKTEADAFIDHWHAKTGADAAKLDWQATWRNWVRAPWKKNGERQPEGTAQTPDQYRQFCKDQLERETARGDRMKILHWRRELEKL